GCQYVRTRRGQALGPRRCPHPLPHLIECVAMILMLALPAATAATGMGAMTGTVTGAAARFSPLTLLLALFMVGYVMWLANNLTALAPVATATTAGTTTATATTAATSYLSPRCAACCKIAMG